MCLKAQCVERVSAINLTRASAYMHLTAPLAYPGDVQGALSINPDFGDAHLNLAADYGFIGGQLRTTPTTRLVIRFNLPASRDLRKARVLHGLYVCMTHHDRDPSFTVQMCRQV
jgi:hypothetical protein